MKMEIKETKIATVKAIKKATQKDTKKETKKPTKNDTKKTIKKVSKKATKKEKVATKKEKKLTKKEIRFQRRVQSDIAWRKLCSAQKKFMIINPRTRCTEIDSSIYKAVYAKSVSKLQAKSDFLQINVHNFRRTFEILISAEEAWEHVEMRKHDMKLVKIKTMEHPRKKDQLQYLCTVPGLSRGQISLIPTDGLIMDDGSTRYSMKIVDIDNDLVIFEPRDSTVEVVIENRKFDISFVPSGICYDRYLKALKAVDENAKFKEILFGENLIAKSNWKPSAKIDYCMSGSTELDARFSLLNARQKQAIIHILEAKCRPNLYILFGPPGTGKTSTVVETVVQIFKRNKRFRILICSSSNTCVDSIASIIYKTRQVDSMVRLSSKYNYRRTVCPPRYYTDKCQDVRSSRVVITTNMMVSQLDPRMVFDYVLVDEAGHAHVLETLIPMTRLHPDGCLVLAGDPRQLGPVIKSFEVERLGLGKSLLERLCEHEIYRRKNAHYDEKYITKLVISYRCDPRILGVCNDLFYHGDLKCLGSTPPSLLKILNVEKPLVFFKVNGQEGNQQGSTSRWNKIEARACIKTLIRLYKMGLEPQQIGIISPYALQKEVLMNIMREQIKKDRPLLDERFKMPQPHDDHEGKAKVSAAKPILISDCKTNGSNISSIKLNDLDFLTKALNKMKLEAQETRIKNESKSKLKKIPAIDWLCKIDTVDAFQGSEREVIIVSTVRSPDSYGDLDQCGFLADAKRFNVTISRAKWLVIVVGHPIVLNSCEYWEQFGKQASQVEFNL